MKDHEGNLGPDHSVQSQLIVLSARLDVLQGFLCEIHKDTRIGDATKSISVRDFLRSAEADKIDRYLGLIADDNPRLATELSQILAELKRDLKS